MINNADYQIAKKSIKNMLKRGETIYPKYFDQLDYDAKMAAIEDFRCPRCHQIKLLTGYFEHYHGTDACCQECSDLNNPRLTDFRKDFNRTLTKYRREGVKK